MALKTEALKKFLPVDVNLSVKKKELAKKTMCPYDEQPNAVCLNRKCLNCGPTKIYDDFADILKDSGNESIVYNRWVYIKTQTDEKVKTTMTCAQKITPFQDLFDELIKELGTFPSHIFRASWQHKQMALCCTTLTMHEVIMVLDFSENYSCRFQNEVQSALFDHQEVTLLPVMLYRQAGKARVICISNDPKHNSDVVKTCEDAISQKIEDYGRSFSKWHQFTDSSATQFKGLKAFADISLRGNMITCNFFETSHGKSVCDGLGLW